jgi:alpha-glucosidase (family GH31 glycosyl hydrolase)
MNRRGHRFTLYNKAHYGYGDHSTLMGYTMPIALSSKMYAIHFDNPQTGYLDFDSKKNNSLSYEAIGGRKTYQVIAGDSWEDVVGNYTSLTGKQPLPPRWAFGNFAMRFGYHNEGSARHREQIHRRRHSARRHRVRPVLVRQRSQRHDGQPGLGQG